MKAGAQERGSPVQPVVRPVSLIKVNVTGELRARLKDRPCAAYDSDLRILIATTGLYTYLDAGVICGPLEFEDAHQDTVLNPTVLVAVLSQSTEAYDRSKKFGHYRQIPIGAGFVFAWSGQRLEHVPLHFADP